MEKGCPVELAQTCKNALVEQGVFSITQAKAGARIKTIVPQIWAFLSIRPSLNPKGPIDLKKPMPPTLETPGPRRPELTEEDVLTIAAFLQARQRSQLSRLTAAGRLRKWGNQ